MKLIDIPDYAKPFKTKGYDVRIVNGVCRLIKITSKRIPDKSYPVLQQEFIGVIDPEKGLIPKKVYPSSISNKEYVEYGLSNFIYSRFKRELLRSLYGISGDAALAYILAAITKYICNSHSDVALYSCYIVRKNISKIDISKINTKRITTVCNKISQLMLDLFHDDLNDVVLLLRNVVVQVDEENPKPFYSEKLVNLLEKHGVKL